MKLLYSGKFNLGKDFQHGQKVKACLFIFVNKLWLLNSFFKKKHANDETIPLYIKSMQIMMKQYHCHLHLVSYCLFIKFVWLKGALYCKRWFSSIVLELTYFSTLRVIVIKPLYPFYFYSGHDFLHDYMSRVFHKCQ